MQGASAGFGVLRLSAQQTGFRMDEDPGPGEARRDAFLQIIAELVNLLKIFPAAHGQVRSRYRTGPALRLTISFRTN